MVFPLSSTDWKSGAWSPICNVVIISIFDFFKDKRMTKTEKVNFVIKTLKDFYPEIPIPLDHKDPYTLLIAVLLSAQCTDVRVNKITPLLFAKADNPYDMVKLSVEEIKQIIRPCGLSPMKSKGQIPIQSHTISKPYHFVHKPNLLYPNFSSRNWSLVEGMEDIPPVFAL